MPLATRKLLSGETNKLLAGRGKKGKKIHIGKKVYGEGSVVLFTKKRQTLPGSDIVWNRFL